MPDTLAAGLPLSGLRVLDLGRVLAAPLAAQILGDLGADVIKIEQPGRGDQSRDFGRCLDDGTGRQTKETGFYLSANRNKRSMAVDLTKPEGQEIVRMLAARADVVIENFLPGRLARFGLDYSAIKALNPRVIYCSITGYGQSGPYSDRPGYDAVFQAQSGMMSVTGLPDEEQGGGPMKTGPSLVDVATGYQATIGILAALFHRDLRGGEGQQLDIALLDTAVAMQTHLVQGYLISEQQPPRLGTVGNGGHPARMFKARDGYFFVNAGLDSHFAALCRALGLSHHLEDPRFKTTQQRFANRDAWDAEAEPVFASHTVAELDGLLVMAGVPCAQLHDYGSLFADEHVRARGIKREVEHPFDPTKRVPTVANPIHFSGTPLWNYQRPPLLGEDTASILVELGFDEAAVSGLTGRGIVAKAR